MFADIRLSDFFACYEVDAIAYTLPILIERLGIAEAQSAYTAAAYLLGSAVEAYVLGNVADSTGRRKALIDHPRCPGSQGVQGRYRSGPHSSSSLRWSSCLSVCTSQGRG